MGSYRGKVSDDVIGSTPSKPDLGKYNTNVYGSSLKKSEKELIKSKLKYQLDLLLDNDPFIENFLYFDDENYISIKYDEKYINNPEILNLKLDNSELSELINLKNENHIFDFEFPNTYIAFGFIKYKDYLAPLFFIPIFFKKEDDKFKISFNDNLPIQFNYYLNDELYEIDFPKFHGNIFEYIKKIEKLDEIKFLKQAFIGNFNCNILNCYADLDISKWQHSCDKFKSYFENEYIFKSADVVKLNNKLAMDWPDLDLKLDDFLDIENVHIIIKNLLADGNSILFVSNKFQRKSTENMLKLSGFDDLILDSESLSENLFNQIGLENRLVNIEDMEEFSRLNEKFSKLNEYCEILEKEYSQLKLTPRELILKKNNYYDKINDINHDFPIKNAKTYKWGYITKIKNEIIKHIENESREEIQNYIDDDYFESAEYKIFKNISDTFENEYKTFLEINHQLNNIYGIKIFHDLNEVSLLNNLNVLENNNNHFIEEEDRFKLNNYLKSELDSISNNDDLDESIEDVLEKYQFNNNILDDIEHAIKYSELIDNNIFEDEDLVKNNLLNVIKDCEVLIKINSYLLKQINYINRFYDKFKCFELKYEINSSKKSISDLKMQFIYYKQDLNKLNNSTKKLEINDSNAVYYVDLWRNGEIEYEYVEDVFLYNVYNSILNSFLDEYDDIDEEKILSHYYEHEREKIYLEIKDKESNQFIQTIILKLNDLNDDKAKNQKEDWNLKLLNNENIPVKDIFNGYKEYIFANKRLFMINIDLLPIFFDESFENYFDYALISNEDINDIYYLPICLRTKNKLIKWAEANNNG